MAIARLGRQAKRPYGLCVKMIAVTVLGLCFIFVWSVFSSSSSVTTRRESFDDIAEPVSANMRERNSGVQAKMTIPEKQKESSKGDNTLKDESQIEEKNRKKMNESSAMSAKHRESKARNRKGKAHEKKKEHKESKDSRNQESGNSDGKESEKDKEEEEEDEQEIQGKDQLLDRESETSMDIDGGSDLVESVDQDSEALDDGSVQSKKTTKRKTTGPLFDPKVNYKWKLCSTRSKHNYIPCIDIEAGAGKLQSYRHTERSCPRTPVMCLVPLSHEGYGSPVPWPDSKLKILYKNVAHPKLAAYIKRHSWLMESGEYLTFPQNQSEFKGGILHYLEYIEEVILHPIYSSQ